MLSVDGRGDLAYARASYSATSEVPGIPEPVSDVGKVLAVLQKQDDGTWLLSAVIYNSDLPLPPAEGEHPEGEEHT
jgi:ketosteroid isomerase-like protein